MSTDKSVVRFAFLLFLTVLTSTEQLKADNDDVVEITVEGKQPGPPMWRISNGTNELWIFAHLSPVPKDMEWESAKVKQVIMGADEAIALPELSVTSSPLMMLNPINMFKGYRLVKRLSRTKDKADLHDVLPATMYSRFTRVKNQYFPRDKDIEALRPLVVGSQMVEKVQEHEGLVPANSVQKQIKRMIRKNKNIKETEVKVGLKIEGGFKSVASRVETMIDSIGLAQELACFDFQLKRIETDLDDMKYRANAWAQGYIDEFRGLTLSGDDDDPCFLMLQGSSEEQTVAQLQAEINSKWLAAASHALEHNKSTFAMLPINDLVRQDGLMAELRALGYEVREP